MATTTTLDDMMGIAIQEAMLTAKANATLINSITRYPLNAGQNSVKIPITGALTAAALTEGNTLSSAAGLATSSVSLTPAYNATVYDTLSDLAIFGSPENASAVLGEEMGNAIAKKINQDIFGLFDGFSTTIGDSTTAINAATIANAHTTLLGAGAPGPFYLVVTNYVYNDILNLYSGSSSTYSLAPSMIEDAQRKGIVGQILGFNVIVVNDLIPGTSAGQASAASIKCGAYSARALGIAYPNNKPLIDIEIQRNNKAIGFDVVGSATYAVGEIKDSYGVEIICRNKP